MTARISDQQALMTENAKLRRDLQLNGFNEMVTKFYSSANFVDSFPKQLREILYGIWWRKQH